MTATRFSAGDAVQTPFGKGIVREHRNNQQVLVEVKGRALVFLEQEITPLHRRQVADRPRGAAALAGSDLGPLTRSPQSVPAEIDLHGLTVEQALATAAGALDDAIRADLPELRFIHGKSGGRIREALHRWLKGIHSVRNFRVDSGNEGVTIVVL